MSKPQDFFGASPKTVLNKPFFHAQDQVAVGVAPQSFSLGLLKRRLGTVVYNDIQGASLASNEVTLPAGVYYIEGSAYLLTSAIGLEVAKPLITDSSNNVLLQGVNTQVYYGKSIVVSGVIILSSPTNIALQQRISVATGPLCGTAANNVDSEVYADLKIWQLDRSLEIAPKAINSGLQTISGMNTEGGIMGGDVTVSGNTLTITKCSCMSSDLTTAMAVTSDTPIVLASTVNGEFYVFMVRLVADGSFTYKDYTTLVGPSSDGLVDKWRLITWAKNNGSGVTMPYKQTGIRYEFLTASKPVLASSLTTSYVAYNPSSVFPAELFSTLRLAKSTSESILVSYDGVTDIPGFVGVVYMPTEVIAGIPLYLKSGSATYIVYIQGGTLRR